MSKYFRAKYALPQGSVLARLYLNNRLVVEGVPVLDRVISAEPNIHDWVVDYDLPADEVTKLGPTQAVRIDYVSIRFYLNEEGLRGVTIAEQDRTNAFDFFKQDMATNAFASSGNAFVFTEGIRHDFTSQDPATQDIYERVDLLQIGGTPASGIRVVIKPLVDHASFAIARLVEIEVFDLLYDPDGVPSEESVVPTLYGFTLSGQKLSLAYSNEFLSEERKVGPISYNETTEYYRRPAVIDNVPATTYDNHGVTLNPGGTKGFYFLDPSAGQVGLSADLLFRETLVRLSLSVYFSVTRDVKSELPLDVRSDLNLAAALLG